MDINGLHVEPHGSGATITIRCHVVEAELADGINASIDWMWTCALATAFKAARDTLGIEFMGGGDDQRAETEETEKDEKPAAGEAPRRARGRRATRGASDDAPSGQPSTSGSRRRRRRSADAAEAGAEDAAGPGGTSHQSSRRRRKKAEADPKPAASKSSGAKDATTKPASSRRRGGGKSAASKTSATSARSSDPITDQDLTKAAGQTSAALGNPDAVFEVLEEFGVGSLGELTDEQRPEFMDALAEKRREAEE